MSPWTRLPLGPRPPRPSTALTCLPTIPLRCLPSPVELDQTGVSGSPCALNYTENPTSPEGRKRGVGISLTLWSNQAFPRLSWVTINSKRSKQDGIRRCTSSVLSLVEQSLLRTEQGLLGIPGRIGSH